MINSDIHNTAIRVLEAFDTMEELQPSDAWQQALLDSLSKSPSTRPARIPRGAILVVALAILVNLAVLATQVRPTKGTSRSRSGDLKIISTELLNEPVSQKE